MARLPRWEPEDQQFWKETGRSIAWRTCGVTTFSLLFSFDTWFVMSAVVVRLPAIGFKFTIMELFWLAAIPGFASGILRLIYYFFIPVLGTRPVVSITTIIKIFPMIWLGYAVQDLSTTWGTFMIIGFLSGLGGGDFSAYMPSTSIFFPKRLQGISLGIQAGIGNFGVSVVQFVTPWIIGAAVLGGVVGGPQIFTKADAIKGAITVTKDNGVVKDVVVNKPEWVPAVMVKNVIKKGMWVQNAAFWYIPPLILAFILCVIFLRSITVKARGFKGQFEILSKRNRALTHTWNCTITYICSFGSFSGYAAAFPMMIKVIYSGFDGGPDPLKYAFLGPLIGGLVRAVTGPIFDRWGGSKGMHWTTLGQILACLALIFGGFLTPTEATWTAKFPGFVWVMLFMFLMTGTNNAATFRQYPIVFAYS